MNQFQLVMYCKPVESDSSISRKLKYPVVGSLEQYYQLIADKLPFKLIIHHSCREILSKDVAHTAENLKEHGYAIRLIKITPLDRSPVTTYFSAVGRGYMRYDCVEIEPTEHEMISASQSILSQVTLEGAIRKYVNGEMGIYIKYTDNVYWRMVSSVNISAILFVARYADSLDTMTSLSEKIIRDPNLFQQTEVIRLMYALYIAHGKDLFWMIDPARPSAFNGVATAMLGNGFDMRELHNSYAWSSTCKMYAEYVQRYPRLLFNTLRCGTGVAEHLAARYIASTIQCDGEGDIYFDIPKSKYAHLYASESAYYSADRR